jgi:hypothetical protein
LSAAAESSQLKKLPSTEILQGVGRMKSLKSSLRTLRNTISTIRRIDEKFDEMKINQGSMLTVMHEQQASRNLRDYEFKVFSQWGEDGIIQHLCKSVSIEHKTFVEFGVENFFEANCRFLLMKDNWAGFVIDGSSENIKTLKNSYFYWKYDLQAIDVFITRENINELVSQSGFDEDLGILSIDLDGNDYHVLDAINSFKPRILICEYNAVFGGTRKITIPYDPGFNRTKSHYSNLYFGASLGAITLLANKRGYSLVGTNSTGVNAFYVRNDLVTEKLRVLSCADAYRPSCFRESRDVEGRLTHVRGDDRLKLIRGLPVFNVETNQMETL